VTIMGADGADPHLARRQSGICRSHASSPDGSGRRLKHNGKHRERCLQCQACGIRDIQLVVLGSARPNPKGGSALGMVGANQRALNKLRLGLGYQHPNPTLDVKFGKLSISKNPRKIDDSGPQGKGMSGDVLQAVSMFVLTTKLERPGASKSHHPRLKSPTRNVNLPGDQSSGRSTGNTPVPALSKSKVIHPSTDNS